jgi:predicted ribonuclease toxin of YeeF-YezG toxin-antitoxin module
MNKHTYEINKLITTTTNSLKVTQINECKNMFYNMSLKEKSPKFARKPLELGRHKPQVVTKNMKIC